VHRFVLEPGLVEALTALGRARGATLFMTLLSAWQALLCRYGGQTDFAVGSPVAGRARPELDGVVGMFVNMLPLRTDLSGDPTVEGLLQRTRTTVLDALAHQDVPFEKVVNDLGSSAT
jgi:non-ribosomal peptide synthetase component F